MDENLANQFQGGYCFIFRLTVDDYHRYHYLDSGTKEEDVFLSRQAPYRPPHRPFEPPCVL